MTFRLAQINVENLSVLQSGSIVVSENQRCEFVFNNGIQSITIEIRFVVDVQSPERQMTSEQLEGRLIILMKNFDSPLGIASTQPIGIGHLNGRPWLWSFFVHRVEKVFLFSYTFYVASS